jgi:hypothetical protein
VGVAVGDPCTDNTAQKDSMDSLWYGHKYGLVDDAVFDKLWSGCNLRIPSLMSLGGPYLVAEQLNRELLLGAPLGNTAEEKKLRRIKAESLLDSLRFPPSQGDPECDLAFRKFLLSSSHALSQSWGDLYIDDYSLFAPVTNQEMLDMTVYMQRSDVRKALHMEEAPTVSWPSSGVGFDYTKEYDACNQWAGEDGLSMIDFYRDIAPRLLVTWVCK